MNQHGPSTIRRLIAEGHYNYYTIKPVLDELAANGFLRKDDKPLAKPGNPIRYHLTTKAMPVINKNWNLLTVLERSAATHRDNFSDLGITNDLLSTVNYLAEPGSAKSWLWLTLLLGGSVLVGLGNLIGLALLAIDGVLYYDDYIRKPSAPEHLIL